MNLVLAGTDEGMKLTRFYFDYEDIDPRDFYDVENITVSIIPLHFDQLDESLIQERAKYYTDGKVSFNKDEETVEFELPTLYFVLLDDGDIVDPKDGETFYYWGDEWFSEDEIEEEIESDLYEELNTEEEGGK